MTREQLTLQLQQEYAMRRENNVRRYEERVDEACGRCPGLRALLDARHAALMRGVRSALYPEQKNPSANVGLPGSLAEYNKQIATLLAAHGVDRTLLQPIYDCPRCKDEGYVYDPSRRMCECFAQELQHRQLAELGLSAEQTFEQFRDDLFPDAPPVSQRSLIRRNRAICESYADAFPQTNPADLLFTGKSGLGKTYLLQAIAHRVAERGFSPLYLSAYRVLELTRKAYFANDSELLRPLLEAPLLLIDDLGTEPLMENITVNQLFNLLNERQCAGRHTVISTNLSIPELKTRYTERIASRLQDASRCRIVKFLGEDIRESLKA